MVSFIIFVGISIVALGVFCLSLVLSLLQFILNFLVANILPIVSLLFGLFALLVILAIFLPEPKEAERKIEDKEDNSQHSTAQAYTRENTASDKEKSNKTTIDVKSTVVKEQAKSDKSHQKKETYQASVKHSTKAKSSSIRAYCSTENKRPNNNNYPRQTSVSTERIVNTQSHFSTKRSSIPYIYFSGVKPELKQLKLSQPKSTIQSGEIIQFKLAGLDKFDNKIEICARIFWTATAGNIDSTGLFSINSKNDVVVTVTARVGVIKVSSTVNVEGIYELIEIPQLKSLKVEPDCIRLKPDEEKVFKAIGYDRHNNPIDCGEIIWSATEGTIDENGKLIVRNYAKGIYQVTATSKHTPKYNSAAKTTLLTLGVSIRILSWAIANEEFFYDVLAPLLNLTNENDSLSETDALVQGWILEIGRRRIAKLLKKASNLSFKEAFSNLSDSVDYIVLPELRKIQFVNPPNNIGSGDRVQLQVIGLDRAGDTFDVQNRIIWTASSGKIDSQGIFIADNDIDSVKISAKVKDKNIEAKISIKIEPYFEVKSSSLTIYSPRFLIQAGQTKKFQIITGFDSQDHPIKYKGEPIIWQTTAGKIDSEGLLITPVTNEDRYIEVSAKIGILELIYSFHTTGLHEYIAHHTSNKLLDIVDDMVDVVDELSLVLSEMPRLEQEINELDSKYEIKSN